MRGDSLDIFGRDLIHFFLGLFQVLDVLEHAQIAHRSYA